MGKIELNGWTIFLLIIGGVIAGGMVFEPVKTLVLLAWTLLVAGVFAAGEMIFARKKGPTAEAPRRQA